MNKEHYSFTTAGSGDENIDLPTDYPYRKLLVRANKAGSECMGILSEFKLTVDQGKFVPFDLHSFDFMRLMMDWFGVAHMTGNYLVDNGTVVYHYMEGEMSAVGIMQGTGKYFMMLHDTWASQSTVRCYDDGGVGLSNVGAMIDVWAPCVESCFCYPFGRQDLIEEAFQAPDFGSVRLVLTQAIESGAAAIMLQQIRTY